MLERLSQISSHTRASATPVAAHPLDPLSAAEIKAATTIVKAAYPDKVLAFNVVSLADPRKAEFLAWQADSEKVAKPAREVDIVALEAGVSGVWEGLVDLTAGKVNSWKLIAGVQPILTSEDLIKVELVIRKDPKVIEQCVISGVPADEMHKVYCDPWTIGYDERFGNERRLQQAIMFYRSDEDDSQYSHPLDFCPIFDTETGEIIAIDIPAVRRPLSKHKHANFHSKAVAELGGYRDSVKPIVVTQPEGVSFKMTGREIEWQNFKFHIGFNYREGIVLNNISYNDHGNVRPLFYRMSLAEMVVPYGNPDHPHHRKHAFDLGEYGGGYMTNSLALGCDCKGVIHYLDAAFPDRAGEPITIKNAICIHEEDDGVLFKHSDFRDNYATTILTRGVKLIVSQIFTAANYEYMVYWIFHMDGTIQLEIKLTGILNTYIMTDDEDSRGFGTRVYPGVNAHNHQHLFSLRINPMIDGLENSVQMVDAVRDPNPVGSKENYYGNAFFPKATVFKTAGEAVTDYDGTTSRTWDMINPNKKHPYSGKPVSYKLVSRESAPLLPKEGSLVWKRAAFARHTIHVTPYVDRQFYPAGVYVPQTSGEPSMGLPEWIGDGSANIENTDVVLWHTFGITHFPAPEDFPIMPAEPMTLLLRPRNFFLQNPALDVPPSYIMTTSRARIAGTSTVESLTDKVSRLAFSETAGSACKCGNNCSGACGSSCECK
ncbi:copper amine oxidase [Lipomyces chichibuensis]|uniref:copper amine oxidase n=1 Tax=Lipomyces chichibuensis TaxID=1546026 RepID=UPI003342FE3D